jgi:hypothetical protein
MTFQVLDPNGQLIVHIKESDFGLSVYVAESEYFPAIHVRMDDLPRSNIVYRRDR